MLGFFAFFCGLMYNDFMSIPLNLFDSCYPIAERAEDPTTEMIQEEDCVYPVGIDPAWYGSEVELTFMNSLKMKLSVIIGVAQMSMGICMKGFNSIYFQNKLDFVMEFIPQIILLLALFGWMDILIISKWLCDFTNVEYTAPSIITIMIDMFLAGGIIEPGNSPVIYGQRGICIFLLFVSLICIPCKFLQFN